MNLGNARARAVSPKLIPLSDFGHNPGALGAKIYVPDTLAPGAALVVVLHGCTQTAEGYDFGSGWSAVSDECGFALLYPEQQRSNNPNLCFNWFLPQDSRRDRGEALSIRNMIAAMVETHRIDPARIYITGLSAGGAMANVMLATYPEIFASGAIMAGLPYGTATDVPQALERMRGQGLPKERELAHLVRGATDFAGEWPTISVWHGSSDATVNMANADAIVTQWRSVHGLSAAPTRTDSVDGYAHQLWCDARGHDRIESFMIAGMAHGTPIATQGPDACGSAGPYMLDKNISSTRHIARFWGLAAERPAHASFESDSARQSARSGARSSNLSSSSATQAPAQEAPLGPSGIGKVIDDALRAAGLLR
jgi:poly(hydroxyalkanoate) depolymerase family esterase